MNESTTKGAATNAAAAMPPSRAAAAATAATSARGGAATSLALLTLEIRYEHDVVLARQRARQIAALLGFDGQDQTRLATAVSELARNAYEYARGGRVQFEVETAPSAGGGGTSGSGGAAGAATTSSGSTSATPRQSLVVRVSDRGPGIGDVQAVLDGRYVSPTGMGVGLSGARRLADRFHIDTAPGAGTTVEIGRGFPRGAPLVGPREAARVADALARQAAQGAFEEVQQQNQELLHTLEELRARQAEVERLNAELAETNRGVLALYAELDDRAQDLRRASEYKSRFLSDISHELRTPLTSVLNMTRFLLDRADGPLTAEQEHQVKIIKRSVESVTEMVNDLLDLARIEAGRTALRPSTFSVTELFAGLRGMFRPLVTTDAVALVFEEAPGLPTLDTDEQRLVQILRNFISNAIKFTERGEIRVIAAPEPGGGAVRFAVRDTGIGIAPADQERIFQDFAQVDGPIQRRVRGTGLGLPLSRKLATLLGGHVELASAPGAGSTFAAIVPAVLPAALRESQEASA
ncbi:MAG TPA: ATP-binding protein [Gemmatimonadaceae bacterium]|nr:ATP-binding protein [Gemmatimonadaceae bacterium]